MTEKLSQAESKALLDTALDDAFGGFVDSYLKEHTLVAAVLGFAVRRARAVMREEVRAAVAEALAAMPAPTPVEKPKRARKAKAEPQPEPLPVESESQDTQGAKAPAEAEAQPAPVIAEEDLPSAGAEAPMHAAVVPTPQPVPETVKEAPAANAPVSVDYVRDIRPLCVKLVSVNANAIRDIVTHFGVANLKDIPAEHLGEVKTMLEKALAARQAA